MPILDRVVQSIRTTGPNPAITGGGGGGAIDPIRFVSGPDFWPSRSSAGNLVTEDKALGLTALYRCVVLIATSVAGQPIHVYEELPDDTKIRTKTLETAYLWARPNPEMTKQTFWETVVGHEVMGDAFLFVVKSGRGDPLSLWYIEPGRVSVGRTTDGQKVYAVTGQEPMIDFADGGEIIHVPNWGRTTLRGVNPLKIAPSAISLGMSAEEYAERFFNQDSTPRGILTSTSDLTVDQADRLSERWHRLYGGVANSNRTAVLGSGATFQPISVNPADAQLILERQFQLGEIARLFGVPPHMIGDTTKSTSWGTGLIEQTQGFVTFTLQAHINRFEQAIDDALLKRSQTNRYVKFDLGGLLRGSTLQRYQAHALGYGRWLTPNDIRRDEDLPPIEGGDVLPTAANLIPLDQLGGNLNPANPDNTAPPTPASGGGEGEPGGGDVGGGR